MTATSAKLLFAACSLQFLCRSVFIQASIGEGIVSSDESGEVSFFRHRPLLRQHVRRWLGARQRNPSSQQINLPFARSDLTSTIAVAPSDEGDLTMGIYLIGGCDEYDHDVQEGDRCVDVKNGTFTYEPRENEFVKRRDMPRRRHRHVSVVVDGDVWVLGGRHNDDSLVAEIDVYNPVHDTWRTLVSDVPSNLRVSDCAAFVRGTSIYVIGGYNGRYQAVDTVFVIDTDATVLSDTFTFRILAPLPTPRGDVHAVNYGRYLYVVGGFTHVNGFCAALPTTEIYNLIEGHWTRAHDLNTARADAALVKLNGNIVAIGGETTHLNDESASCTVTSDDTTNSIKAYRKRLVAKTFPVNSIELLDPSIYGGKDAEWSLAYTDALPPNNRVFRSVAVAWNGVVYAFGGVKYEGRDAKAEQALSTSDLVTIFTEEDLHTRRSFRHPFRGGRIGGGDNDDVHRNYLTSLLSNEGGFLGNVIVMLMGCVLVSSACVYQWRKRQKIRRKKKNMKDSGRNIGYHMGSGTFDVDLD